MERYSFFFFALAAVLLAPPASGYLFSDTDSEGADSNAAELGTFIPPSPGSTSRSPCPAINILANHGYINRSGRDVDADDMFIKLEEVFGTKSSFAKFIFEGAAGRGMEIMTAGNQTLFDIDAMFNYEDAIDFDGSLFYPDRPAPQTNSQELFDEMVEGYCRREDPDSQTCTFQDFVDFTVARLRDSCENTPGAFEPADAKGVGMRYHQVRTGNAFFAFLSLQGKPPEFASLDATAPVSDLEDTLVRNRLPDGFVPRATKWDGTEPENAPVAVSLAGRFCAEAAFLGAGGCAVPQCPPPPSATDGKAESASVDEDSETDAKMDHTSSIVAAASAGSIFAIFWVAASTYLFGQDKQDNGVTVDRSHLFTWTFHVESLRFFAMINLLVVMIIGALITEKSGLDTIPDSTETVIFNLFGLNHACNWIDHNPSRLIAAILVMPLVQVPLMLYTIFWHCRLAKDVKTGKVPKWLLNVSRVFTPFNLFTVAELHLWFVNNPDDTYGFTAHYIPYFMYQIAFCLFQLLNVSHLTFKGNLPWGIPSWVAWTYSSFFSALTIFCCVFVISTLEGDPIIAVSRSSKEEAFAHTIVILWGTLGVLGTLILSGKERLNGDVITLTIGDDVLSLESAQKERQSAVLRDSVSFAAAPDGEENTEEVDEEDIVFSSTASMNEEAEEINVGMKNESDITYRRPCAKITHLPIEWDLQEIVREIEKEEAHESEEEGVYESKEEEKREGGAEEKIVIREDKHDFDAGHGINRCRQTSIDPPIVDPSTDSGTELDRASHPHATKSPPETTTASSAGKVDNQLESGTPTGRPSLVAAPHANNVTSEWGIGTMASGGSRMMYYDVEEGSSQADRPGDVNSTFFNVWERGAGRIGPLRVPNDASLSFRDIRSVIRTQLNIESFQFVLDDSAPFPTDMEWLEFYHRYFSGATQTGDGTLTRPYKIEIAMTSTQPAVSGVYGLSTI